MCRVPIPIPPLLNKLTSFTNNGGLRVDTEGH